VGEAKRFLGVKAIAALFDVQPNTVTKWRSRYAGTTMPCPEPTAWIDDVPGWDSPAAWTAWKISLPGQGAGGGPLPITYARNEWARYLEQVRAAHPDASDDHRARRAQHLIAEEYGTDRTTVATIWVNIAEANPDLPNAEVDVLTAATLIRGARQARPSS
jgi:hypothetical protein